MEGVLDFFWVVIGYAYAIVPKQPQEVTATVIGLVGWAIGTYAVVKANRTGEKGLAIQQREAERIRAEEADQAEADRVVGEAINDWQLSAEAARQMFSDESPERFETLYGPAGPHSRVVTEKSKLAASIEKIAVQVQAAGKPRMAITIKIMAHPLVQSAVIEGDGYEIRLRYDRETFYLSK